MLGSLIFAMVDRWPSEPVWPSGDQRLSPMLQLAVSFLLAVAAIALLARILPRTSLNRHLVLQAAVPNPGHPVVAAPEIGVRIGDEGRARTTLRPIRPSGKALFAAENVPVVSSGPLIEAGAAVRVVAIEGTRVVVEEISETRSS